MQFSFTQAVRRVRAAWKVTAKSDKQGRRSHAR